MLNLLPLLLLLLFTSVPFTQSVIVKRQQVCDNTWALCYPDWNSTWYQYKTYKFIFQSKSVDIFDLYLLTNNNDNNNNTGERTIKSWYNLTNVSDLTIQVTDDWFPCSNTINTTTTWIMYAYLLPHNTILPPNLDLSATQINPQDPYVKFHIVQLPFSKPMIREEKAIAHRWILAIIIISCLLVILAFILVVFYKNMQKAKKKQKQALEHKIISPQQHESILSTNEAILIADTFRQVMMSPSPSQQEIAQEKKRMSQDLLYRQLQAEQGTSVLEINKMSKHHTLVNAINGVFSVYKPKGWTSRKATDVVQFALCNELCQDPQVKLKRRDRLKIGHGGTLDPLAEGVLVLGVGKGCKELQKYLKGPKEYLVSAKFGTSTTTYDSEGQEIKKATTKHMTKELILKTLPHFTGTITQVPPIYSALKIQGKRLYDYARNDLPLPEPIQPRQVTIKELELIEFKKEEDECILRVICGGGTYMRSLVNDLAIAMGTYGHMTALKRTKQGLFSTEDTLSLLDSSLTVKNVLDKIASGESKL